jgi:WD40 repeat protein
MYTLEGHPDPVTCLAFSPRGKVLASGDDGGGLNLWELKRRRVMSSTYLPGVSEGQLARHVTSVAYSRDGKYLATTTGMIPPFVRVWAWKAGKLHVLHEWEGTFSTSCAVFLPDGRTVVSGGGTGYRDYSDTFPILRWNMDTDRHRAPLCGHTLDVFALDCSPDGKLIASGGADRSVRLWNSDTGQEVGVRTFRGWVRAVAFSPRGTCLAVAAGRGVYLWEVEGAGARVRVLRGHSAAVCALAFHPDGGILASAGNDAEVRLWDAATGGLRGCYGWKVGPLGCVAFAPDGLTAAVGSTSGAIVVWDVDEV